VNDRPAAIVALMTALLSAGGQRGDVEIDAILDSRARRKPHVDLGAVRAMAR